jgi:hypothetical protein
MATPPAGKLPLPGTSVTIHDTLDAADFVQGRLDPVPVRLQRTPAETPGGDDVSE